MVLLLKFRTIEEEATLKTHSYRNFLSEKGSQVLVKNQGKKIFSLPNKRFWYRFVNSTHFSRDGDLLKQMKVEIQRDDEILRAINYYEIS